MPCASYQLSSASRSRPSLSRIRATPFIFLQRPFPYKRRSLDSSRMPLPVAIVSTSARSPISSKSIQAFASNGSDGLTPPESPAVQREQLLRNHGPESLRRESSVYGLTHWIASTRTERNHQRSRPPLRLHLQKPRLMFSTFRALLARIGPSASLSGRSC